MTSYLRVDVWHDQNTSSTAMDHAEAALTEIEDQTDKNLLFNRRGEIHLDYAPYDTYGEFKNNFEYETRNDREEGRVSLLIYTASILDGWLSCSDSQDYPYLGIADTNAYKYGNDPVALANYDTLQYGGEWLLWNVIMHEVLHTCACDHTDGENYYGENSPMITGYAESVSNNDKPPTSCNDAEIKTVDDWTNRMSACTTRTFEDWLDNNYY